MSSEKETSNAGMQLVRDKMTNGEWGNQKWLPSLFYNNGHSLLLYLKNILDRMVEKIVGRLSTVCGIFLRHGNKECLFVEHLYLKGVFFQMFFSVLIVSLPCSMSIHHIH